MIDHHHHHRGHHDHEDDDDVDEAIASANHVANGHPSTGPGVGSLFSLGHHHAPIAVQGAVEFPAAASLCRR